MRKLAPKTVTAPPRGTPDTEGEPAERQALDRLFSTAYEELRRLAASVRRDDPAATLSPTALVHEAWLKLAGSPGLASLSPAHFKRIAARAMRQVLVDAARRRKAGKRGAGAALVTLDETVAEAAAAPARAVDVLALDAALERLGALNPRQAALVEARFFGGLDVPEVANLIGVSEATVLRDWRVARAWLARELRSST